MVQANNENEIKKAYLLEYRKLFKRENELDEEIREIQLNKTHPSFSADGMPKGNGKSDLSNYAAVLDEKEREREEVIERKSRQYEECMKRINRLEDESQKLVLILYYNAGLSWRAVAQGMNKSIGRVFKIHGQALKNFRME